ncbi:MAG: 4-phosphopantetheinyl transferase family protein, partial [Flavobacteriales bacterium]|nr:4-phosphopantetheinyl transferase family protein [Flavobacteriales bacterium]
RFLQIWTAKEAYVKYLGTGLAALKTADFSELQPRLQQIINKDYILSIYQ